MNPEPMVAGGLVGIESGRVKITRRGQPLMRTIAAVFDRYPNAAEAEDALPARYSRAVQSPARNAS